LSSPDSAVKVSPPGVSQHSPTNLGFAKSEHQIKYLGLVIEKDEEYVIEKDDKNP